MKMFKNAPIARVKASFMALLMAISVMSSGLVVSAETASEEIAEVTNTIAASDGDTTEVPESDPVDKTNDEIPGTGESNTVGTPDDETDGVNKSNTVDTPDGETADNGDGSKTEPLTIAAAESAETMAASASDFGFASGVITGYTGSDDDVIIPETIGGEKVVKIDELAFQWSSITSVTIPASVTEIGWGAFSYCEYLVSVTFLGADPTLGDAAFMDCSKPIVFRCHIDYKDVFSALLEEYIDHGGIHSLETIEKEPEPQHEEDLKYTSVDGGYVVSGYIGKGGAVEIPATYDGKPVVGIADHAFDGIAASSETVGRLQITSITMPDSVTFIGDWAFAKCQKMESIKLSSNLTKIGENAFQYCNKLTAVDIPASVTDIGDLAFTMCLDMVSINVEDENPNYSHIDGVLFNKDKTTLIRYPSGRADGTYAIPDGVEEIAHEAFKLYYEGAGTRALKDVTYPESLQKIGNNAFMQTNLEKITIYTGIKMGTGVYQLCQNLKKVVVAEGVTEIQDGLLYGLDYCEEVILPSTLKTIGYRAFDRCNIKSIILPEGLETIGEEAFEVSKLTSITIPSTVTTIGARAFYLSKIQSLNFAPNAKITSIGAYAFNHCKELSSVNLPTSVKVLEDGAFSHCYALKSIDLPNSITTFGNSVLAGSNLESIKLPNSITNMGSCTFRDCLSLTSVTMPAYLETLGTCTFEECQKLVSVTFPSTIKLTTVPTDTFFKCQTLKYIYLPDSIATTEACSFSNCKELQKVEYANKNLKRSLFDCYSIDPGEYYELRDDGYYYTTAAIDGEDNSNGAYDKDKLNPTKTLQFTTTAGGTVKGKLTEGQDATCGCGTSGANIKLSATSNPSFNYVQLGSGGSGSTGSSGSNGGSSQNSGSTFTVANTTLLPGTSGNVSSNGFVNSSKATSQLKQALQAATGNEAAITVKNAKSISASTLKALTKTVGNSGKTAIVHADTLGTDGKIQGRLYIEPAKLVSLKSDFNLGISTMGKKPATVKAIFEKYFNNQFAVIHCEQSGDFGARLQIAAKVDLSKLNTKNLGFYSYNIQTNSYQRIESRDYFIDSNGYLHFYTSKGGSILVTDKLLTKK